MMPQLMRTQFAGNLKERKFKYSQMELERLKKISAFFSAEKVLSSGGAGVQAILKGLPASSSSETSTDSEESEQDEESNGTQKGEKFCETIETYSDSEFKSVLKLERSTVEFLIEKFKASIVPKDHHGGKAPIPPWKKFYIYICFLTKTITFRELSEMFGVSISTAWHCVNSISAWLITIGNEYIKWPYGTEAAKVQKTFQEKCGIPGIIGAIGCIYIPIKAPKDNTTKKYLDKNGRYSLVLQGVVDADNSFTDITCGEPGSLHASEVLWRSNLFQAAQSEQQTLFSDNSFILGNSAYPSTNWWLVPPFKDSNDHLTESQRNFNELHSSTVNVVQNTFDKLKSRFIRLLQLNEPGNMNFIINITVSACVLHNICIRFNDDVNFEINSQNEDSEYSLDDEFFDEEDDQSSEIRRNVLFEFLQNRNSSIKSEIE